jgi:uncharacterized protein (DUF2267 family)
MNDEITSKLLLDALGDAGMRDRVVARRIVDATLAVLVQRLTTDERQTFARCLSPALRDEISMSGGPEAFDGEGLYRRVARRARSSASLAREPVLVVIETIGRHASYEVLRRLSPALPPEVAELLHERELGDPAPYVETFPAAQAHSVVREDNPHGDRKLSSGKPNLRPSDPARPSR